MKNNLLKDTFEFMKGLGYFPEFSSYEDWQFKRFGEKETLEEWKERELSDEDQQRFDYIFGD